MTKIHGISKNRTNNYSSNLKFRETKNGTNKLNYFLIAYTAKLSNIPCPKVDSIHKLTIRTQLVIN